MYYQPNKNHKLISSGNTYSKKIISDEIRTNQNNSTRNNQKTQKEIILTHQKKGMKKNKTIKQIILLNTDTTQTSKYGTPYSIIKVYGHIKKSKIISISTPGK